VFCFYHLTQSIRREVQSLRLANLYEINRDLRLFCNQIEAVDELTDGMIHFKNTSRRSQNSGRIYLIIEGFIHWENSLGQNDC